MISKCYDWLFDSIFGKPEPEPPEPKQVDQIELVSGDERGRLLITMREDGSLKFEHYYFGKYQKSTIDANPTRSLQKMLNQNINVDGGMS